MSRVSSDPQMSLYRQIARADWAALAAGMDQPLTESEVVQIRGLGDRLDVDEVRDVYLPLSRLLSIWANGFQRMGNDVSDFLHRDDDIRTPFVVGVAGSVSVGKSTIARLLRELMSRWSTTPRVDLVTTDGFLYPNAELERRGLMGRKGFPESYDRRALVEFLTEVKSGADVVHAPFYSHVRYDIVPDAQVTVRRPDVVIVEGLNVLQPPPAPNDVAVSELFDFSVYVDAEAAHIERWFVDRFLKLREGAFSNPASYFNVFAGLSDAEAEQTALGIWRDINMPNLVENVLPTKHRATLVLQKGEDHAVESVLLRKA
ncbi:type I pantothenate kinase [Microbacterium halophytorum]|uniref:type I pantothenate kinase n=1 Tax=Microbacterium halophytorum TaxID=2067568 RepID=UPI000CFDBB21|nr:type I pantothenate kinase [Microbacterium halophytorum]